MTTLRRALLQLNARNSFFRHSRNHCSRNGQRHASSENGPRKGSGPNQRPSQPMSNGSLKAEDDPIDIPTLLWHQRLGPVTDFFSWFHRTQQKRPLTVQVCTSLTVYLCGDLLAQEIGGEKYDSTRTLRMLTIGAVASIPGYKWFLFLGNHFNYPSKLLSIFTKVAVQQICFTPIFNTYFFGMQAVLTNEPPSGVLRRIKQAVPESIVNSLKLWPAVTAFSFTFIMPQYRFMFSGIFAVCWQTYLSYLNRREEKNEMVSLSKGSARVIKRPGYNS